MEIKPLMCVNCGAPINLDTLKCEYCGTGYKKNNDKQNFISFVRTHADLMRCGNTRLTPNELREAFKLQSIKTRGVDL